MGKKLPKERMGKPKKKKFPHLRYVLLVTTQKRRIERKNYHGGKVLIRKTCE